MQMTDTGDGKGMQMTDTGDSKGISNSLRIEIFRKRHLHQYFERKAVTFLYFFLLQTYPVCFIVSLQFQFPGTE